MMNSDDEPARLPVAALIHLSRFGDLIRAAPTERDRAEAITFALATAYRYREDGSSWADIAVALGFTERQLQNWRFGETAKPPAVLPSPQPGTMTARPPPPTPGPITETISSHHYQSQSIAQTSDAVSHHYALDALIPPPAMSATHRRGVVVVSGDPRPGGNLFGPETAAIRRPLRLARIEVWELACADLTEIASGLARYRPAVLHIAAHHENGGVVLSAAGTPLWTSHDTLARQIVTPTVPPKLVVLNACGSVPLAAHLVSAATAVIAWPGQIDDAQARGFAHNLYENLACGAVLATAFNTAADATTERWPGLDGPILYRPGPHPLF